MRITKILACCLYALALGSLLVFSRAGLAERNAGVRAAAAGGAPQDPCAWPLPFLPSSKRGIDAFEKVLSDYVNNKCYQTDKRWKADNQIRDTGLFIPGMPPFVDGQANKGRPFGTHNAVRVYYSPEVVKWLTTGRKEDDIDDGAVIIKEMYPMPAGQQSPSFPPPGGWAIMVRDKKGAWDGWFWSDGSPKIDYSAYQNAGFGLYCINCHASAKTDLTFSALRNITGSPLAFNPTMQPAQIAGQAARRAMRPSLRAAPAQPQQGLSADQDLAVHSKRDLFISPQEKIEGTRQTRAGDMSAAAAAPVAPKQLVGQWYDHVPQNPESKDRRMFLTSNQCIGCHDSTQNNAGQPNMVYPQIYDPGPNQVELDLNNSPYGEWRASMMGLSGRDPVFYSQLETEINLHPELKEQTVNTCLSCHGVMGKRQIDLDKKGPFKLEYLDLKYPEPYSEYGALARDGVSCAVCHHISAEDLGKPSTFTGKFKLGRADEIFGPFEDVVTTPMKNGLGLTPLKTKENQIRSSALCGSCHTVVLPVLNVGQKYPPGVFDNPPETEHEQNTYLEWLNSVYQDERQPVDQAKKQSCQDCHMPDRYPAKTGNRLTFKIASIEEDTFPTADFRAPDEDIHLKVRGNEAADPYGRHTLVGLNLFVMEIFNQFYANLLGGGNNNWSTDPMNFWGNPVPGLILAKKSGLDQARNETAKLEIASLQRTPRGLTASVKVSNIAGHKFPSGVSFRRAFIEFRVTDSGGRTLWVSGATNDKGVILGPDPKTGRVGPLVTEFFDKASNPEQKYQPHYDGANPIDRQDEVQIYEELVKDSNGNFTTSFLSLKDPIKDNRLMPQGWREDGPNAHETRPVGVDRAANPGYFDGSGTDLVTYQVPLNVRVAGPLTVTATIYYQTIPPYYLQQRSAGAPDGVFTKSLMYYTERLDTNKMYPGYELLLPEAPIKGWKLKITSASRKLP
jgi:nitrate/TMAO reductase-like tetraheme cytochrome c subunit